VSVGVATLPVPIRPLEDCDTTAVVLFWYSELRAVLKTVPLVDTGVVETEETTVEFAALLVCALATMIVELLAITLACDDVGG